MSTQWTSQVLGKTSANFGELLKDEYAVVLLQGKNIFGDMIYCYLKVTLPEIAKLESALRGTANFNISDYGTVVAAGNGYPTEEIKAEIASTYPMLPEPKLIKSATSSSDTASGTASGSTGSEEKKAWDEY